jgi:hypothetical protein
MDALILLHDVPPKSTGTLSGCWWLRAANTLSLEFMLAVYHQIDNKSMVNGELPY